MEIFVKDPFSREYKLRGFNVVDFPNMDASFIGHYSFVPPGIENTRYLLIPERQVRILRFFLPINKMYAPVV